MFTPVETAKAIMRMHDKDLLPRFLLIARDKKSMVNIPIDGKFSDTYPENRYKLYDMKGKRKGKKGKERLTRFIKEKFYKQLKKLVGKSHNCMVASFAILPYSCIFEPAATEEYTVEELSDANVLVIRIIRTQKKAN